jgi:hypothetical protein
MLQITRLARVLEAVRSRPADLGAGVRSIEL